MSVKMAKAYYFKTGNGKLNCAQAIVAAYKGRYSLDDGMVERFSAYGSGKAPGGECGALYSAKAVLGIIGKGKAGELESLFLSKAGSTKCKEIRQLKKLSCAGCLETAAGYLDGLDSGQACGSGGEGCVRGISLERQIRIISGMLVIIGIALGWLVHWAFLCLSLFVGCGLVYAGVTDNCLMALLLAKLPYNKER